MRNNPGVNSQSGWRKYLTSSVGLKVLSVACGAVTAVAAASIYFSPTLGIAFVAFGNLGVGLFFRNELTALKVIENTPKKLKGKLPDDQIVEIQKSINVEFVNRLKPALNWCAGSAAVVALSVAYERHTHKNSEATLVVGSTALLFGFGALMVLRERAEKFRDRLNPENLLKNPSNANPVVVSEEFSSSRENRPRYRHSRSS